MLVDILVYICIYICLIDVFLSIQFLRDIQEEANAAKLEEEAIRMKVKCRSSGDSVFVDCLLTTGVVRCVVALSSDNRCCQVCLLIVF